MNQRTHEIQGQTVSMPVEVRDAGSGMANFLVPSRLARAFVGDAFDVPDFLPGRTLLMLGCIDYRDNDLGDYNEVVINFFVREKGARGGLPFLGPWIAMGRGKLPTYTYRMPVNQSFTCEAGCSIWGFPKTVERIDVDYSRPDSFGARLEMDGQLVFDLRVPRGGKQNQPPMDLEAYTYLNGAPHRTAFTQEVEGLGVSMGAKGFSLELGSHPLADELRSLGLPKKPLLTMWFERMKMRFGEAEALST